MRPSTLGHRGLFGSDASTTKHPLFEDPPWSRSRPDGHRCRRQPGARLLVTNLYNLVQPLLRLEVTDLVTLDPDPCPCGRTMVRVSTIHGRSDDVLSLAARDGGRVAVHPLHFALLTRDPQVREFQVVQDGPVLRILIVPRHATAAGNNDLETRLDQAVTQQLLKLGVHDPQISVERRQQLPRSAGGKLKLVIADPNCRPVPTNAH